MIKDLADALIQLINSLSTRPIATLAGIFLLAVGYIAYMSYNSLEAIILTPEEEALRFEEQLTTAKLVNESLEHLRADLNASYVSINQFHNGRHDLTGIPFTEASATYYTGEYTGPSEEPVPVMNATLRLMWQKIDKPVCIILTKPIDSSSRKYFSKETMVLVKCPLVNLLNYPIGMLTVGLPNDNNTIDALAKTSAMSKKITGYLHGTI